MALTGPLVCTPDDFTTAGKGFCRVHDEAAETVTRLVSTLAGCGRCAGTDTMGQAWSRVYDPAATSAMEATAVIVGAGQLSDLLNTAGANHDNANTQSSVTRPCGGAPSRLTWRGTPGPTGTRTSCVPPPTPGRARGASCGTLQATFRRWCRWVQQQQSPEVPGAVTACEGLSRNMMTVADEFAVLGKACADYAGNIDEAHSKVLHELVTLGWQTGAIEGIAAVAAFSTFGGSEVAGQVVEAERLAVIGARIAGVLGAATLSAAPTIPAVASFGQVVDELGPLLEARATLYGSEAPGVIPALGEVAKDVAARRVKLRVGVKQAVRDEAKKTPAGDFIDPYSDQIIPKEGPFDYGHKEGVEWWRTQEQARREGWTRQQLLDFENIPEHYQIQNWA